VANENHFMVLVRARQRKRQSMEGFAQEDIPPRFETEPLESEKCLSAIENKRSYTSVDFGWQPHDRQEGRRTSVHWPLTAR